MNRRLRVTHKSGFESDPKRTDSLAFEPSGLGQCCPQHYPYLEPMGTPLSTEEAARVIGCSAWTVRQKLVPRGLPHFRCGGGRLIFYKTQIIRWVEAQQKGVL